MVGRHNIEARYRESARSAQRDDSGEPVVAIIEAILCYVKYGVIVSAGLARPQVEIRSVTIALIRSVLPIALMDGSSRLRFPGYFD